MKKIVFVALLLIYFLLISRQAVYCRDHRKHGHLSAYLEPPPATKSIRTVPFLHKHPPSHKPLKHAAPKDHFGGSSMLPKLSKWFWPNSKPDGEKASASSNSILQTRSHDYALEEAKCNPCNSVPWIPIVGSHRPKHLEPTYQQTQDYASNSYYSSFNEMSSHLNPLNVMTAYSSYFGNPPYTQELPQNLGLDHLQDHAFASNIQGADFTGHLHPQQHPQHQGLSQFQTQHFTQNHHGLDLTQNHLQENPTIGYPTFWNSPSFSASASDNVHEPSLYNFQGLPNVGFNNSADPWLYEPKAVPMSQYLLSVDHPLQVYQTPLLDVPSFHAPNSANLPLHVQQQVYQKSTIAPPAVHEVVIHEVAPSGQANNGLSHNSIDDTKYSPSETFNETSTNDLDDSEDLPEYLTPPEAASDDWTEAAETRNAKKTKQIQIVIPYTIDKNKIKIHNYSDWTTEKPLSQRLREIWAQYVETTTPLPIISYLKGSTSKNTSKYTNPPKRQEWSDMLRLQKAIDTWTVEGYSNHKNKPNDYYFQKVATSTLPPSKEIPTDYLGSTTRVEAVRNFRGVRNQIPVVEEKMHEEPLHRSNSSKPWEKLAVSVSPLTKEKVYIVTPLPLKSYNFSAQGVVENWP